MVVTCQKLSTATLDKPVHKGVCAVQKTLYPARLSPGVTKNLPLDVSFLPMSLLGATRLTGAGEAFCYKLLNNN